MNLSSLAEQNTWCQGSEQISLDPTLMALKDQGYVWAPGVLEEFHLDQDLIYIFKGPRQVGKTTLLKTVCSVSSERSPAWTSRLAEIKKPAFPNSDLNKAFAMPEFHSSSSSPTSFPHDRQYKKHAAGNPTISPFLKKVSFVRTSPFVKLFLRVRKSAGASTVLSLTSTGISQRVLA